MHYVRLVCTRCGRSEDLKECADLLGELENRAATRAAFRLEQEQVDLFGTCAECNAAAELDERSE
jgi:Fe2+ or Zn2+ uptake regulation protein